jgi:hypothetical protein
VGAVEGVNAVSLVSGAETGCAHRAAVDKVTESPAPSVFLARLYRRAWTLAGKEHRNSDVRIARLCGRCPPFVRMSREKLRHRPRVRDRWFALQDSQCQRAAPKRARIIHRRARLPERTFGGQMPMLLFISQASESRVEFWRRVARLFPFSEPIATISATASNAPARLRDRPRQGPR